MIDNGIIVVEDYKFRRSQNLSIKESINQTLTQLTTPLAAATGTTVFAFLPIVTGEGSSIEYVGGLAITVIMSIVSSLVLALIMVPVLMSYMEKIPMFANIKVHEEGYRNEKLLKKYSLKDTVNLIMEIEKKKKKKIYDICLKLKNEKNI